MKKPVYQSHIALVPECQQDNLYAHLRKHAISRYCTLKCAYVILKHFKNSLKYFDEALLIFRHTFQD